jgi:hypothetical protein
MEGRDPGYDDWFDEPEAPTDTQGDATRGAQDTRGSHDADDEVWVLPEDEEPRRTARREIVVAGRTLTTTQVAIIAGSFLVLLIAILAATGVFSSNNAPTPPVTTPTTPPPPKTTASTPTTTAVTATAPSQPLSPGATGSEVKNLQESLKALGYDPGTIDGNYGPSTESAVSKFQAANGLATDGVVGPETLAKLQQALSG